MLSLLKNRFGVPGVIAVVALVFAMLGGAYAATSSPRQSHKKAEKGLTKAQVLALIKSHPGPAGAQGAAGANGKDGANGQNGGAGTNGTNGTDGDDGQPGKSVELSKYQPGEEGPEEECGELGAILVKVQGATTGFEACNGGEGEKGDEGSPWTDGGTLPPGATETGVWSVNGTEADTGGVYAPISFPIPLTSSIDRESEQHIHYFTDSDFATYCVDPPVLGGRYTPKALPGEMCIWKVEEHNATFDGITAGFAHGEFEEISRVGGTLHFQVSGVAFAAGTWAVTGCSGSTGPNACP
jgi:hypothetical protein